jgi:hypothetical protein
MMNLFAEYYKERQELETIITDYGFLTYGIHQDHALLGDIFVLPEFRGTSKALELYNLFFEKAKEAGCQRIFANFSVADKAASRNLGTVLRRRFKIVSADKQVITVCKEL